LCRAGERCASGWYGAGERCASGWYGDEGGRERTCTTKSSESSSSCGNRPRGPRSAGACARRARRHALEGGPVSSCARTRWSHFAPRGVFGSRAAPRTCHGCPGGLALSPRRPPPAVPGRGRAAPAAAWRRASPVEPAPGDAPATTSAFEPIPKVTGGTGAPDRSATRGGAGAVVNTLRRSTPALSLCDRRQAGRARLGAGPSPS